MPSSRVLKRSSSTLTSITSGLATLGATLAATNTIADNDSATVTIANTTNGAEAGPVNGVMTVTQTAVSATNTVIAYRWRELPPREPTTRRFPAR